ncbi:hypothetical protein EG347_13680 [Chryseobacterium sp. G0186]|nr:hypothetical protein EG347_13680 [Chryseobacterium sp. G0186]
MNIMLNKLAYGVKRFYLCPTENESISKAQKRLWIGRNIKYYERDRRKKNFHFFIKKSCGLKKSLYLCSPNKTGA